VSRINESAATLRRAREHVLGDAASRLGSPDTEPNGPRVRPDIATSWRRCQLSGVAINGEDVPYNPELEGSSRLLRAAAPVIDRLAEQLTDCPATIILANSEAQILRRAGGRELIQVLDRALVAPGFRYAEECTGTNGIGSPLEDRGPFFVQGGEHFRENLLEFACMGAPVVHPISGAVEGVLDVTCRFDDSNVLMKPLVLAAVREIESRIHADASLNERMLLDNFLRVSRKTSSAVVSLNRDFIISNTAASKLLDPSDQVLLWNWASCMLTGRDECSGDIRLAQDIVVQAKASKVGEGSSMAGVLVQMRVRQRGPAAARSRASIAARPPGRSSGTVPDALPGRSAASARLRREIDAVVESGLPVLVCGEPGSGKLFIAAHLCKRWDPDEACTVLDGRVAQHDPDAWLERFAARIATPGTVVLRHLDDLPAVLCPQLLAHLDAGSGRARLIATAKERGGYGPAARLLDHFPASLVVPPLRYRAEDIADIAPVIIRQRTGRSPAPRLQPATFQTLIGLDWPGNFRELEAVLTSAVLQSMGSDITQAHLPPEYRSSPTRHRLASLERAERDTILQALADTDGNKRAAAERLGIARSTLYRKMRALGIDDKRLGG
jgi:sigma-54 dependent transcriptional regulator, acetoin dehydrogenase operon transcriptional activator AcoR